MLSIIVAEWLVICVGTPTKGNKSFETLKFKKSRLIARESYESKLKSSIQIKSNWLDAAALINIANPSMKSSKWALGAL